jgi:hypothetical protein
LAVERLRSCLSHQVESCEGVRQHLRAGSFPFRVSLNLFLLLSSSRKGQYAGKILVVNEQANKTVRYVKVLAAFEDDNELLPLYVDVGDCIFPGAGQYSFQIYFSARDGSEALKGEHPFTVLAEEE